MTQGKTASNPRSPARATDRDRRWRLAKAGRTIWRVAVLSRSEVFRRLEERPSKVGPVQRPKTAFGAKSVQTAADCV
jgi:hypothetical protein